MSDYQEFTTTQLSRRLRLLLERFGTSWWTIADREEFECLWDELRGRIDGRLDPSPLRIKDIKKGDQFIQEGKVVWTATGDAQPSPSGEVYLKVQLDSDMSLEWRFWKGDCASLALDGLTRPVDSES